MKLKNKIIFLLLILAFITTILILSNYDLYSLIKANDNIEDTKSTKYEKDKINEINEEKLKTTYYIYWILQEKEIEIENPIFIKKEEPFIYEFKIPQDNLKSIRFSLDWTDDLTFPFFNFGKDKLFFSIYSPEHYRIYKKSSIGEEYISYEIDDINKKPSINIIESPNQSYLDKKISKYYNQKWKNETIRIKILIETGEIGPLRRIIDKGNNIKLKIFYKYYEPEIITKKDNPPVTTIISGPYQLINSTQVEFIWIGSDDFTPSRELEYSFRLSNQIYWSPWTKQTSVRHNNLLEGHYTFYVKCRDHRGNIESVPANQSFTVKIDKDRSSPDTKIISGPTGKISVNTVEISWTGSDETTDKSNLLFSYKLEGYDLGWSSWSKTIKKLYYNLQDGKYIFKVKAKDEAGNIDPSPAKIEFTIDTKSTDTKAPDTEIIEGPDGVINYTTVIFRWTGNDDTTETKDLLYKYKLKGYDSSWSDWLKKTQKTYSDLLNGEYIFKVKSKDEAGNIDLSPAERIFNIYFEPEPNRFATKVIEINFGQDPHPDFMDPLKVLDGPKGLGDYQGSLDVLSLGINGNITLGFDVTIINKPGYDFIIFENPFRIVSQPEKVYAELMFVEVSTDGINFVRFPCISNTQSPGTIYPEDVTNLAGVWPVYANVDENDIDPFNPDISGGDAFDLDDLVNDIMVQSGLVDLQNIQYIKLIDIRGDGTFLDSNGNPIFDAIDMDNGADLDAVAVINYKNK